jgi:hypothetical protein
LLEFAIKKGEAVADTSFSLLASAYSLFKSM